MSHVILLIQPTEDNKTRTFTDYPSLDDCLEGIIKIYDRHLTVTHQDVDVDVIEYTLGHVFAFLDRQFFINLLAYETSKEAYSLFDVNWVKRKLLGRFKKQIKTIKKRRKEAEQLEQLEKRKRLCAPGSSKDGDDDDEITGEERRLRAPSPPVEEEERNIRFKFENK